MGCFNTKLNDTPVLAINSVPQNIILIELRDVANEILENVMVGPRRNPISGPDLFQEVAQQSRLVRSGKYGLGDQATSNLITIEADHTTQLIKFTLAGLQIYPGERHIMLISPTTK